MFASCPTTFVINIDRPTVRASLTSDKKTLEPMLHCCCPMTVHKNMVLFGLQLTKNPSPHMFLPLPAPSENWFIFVVFFGVGVCHLVNTPCSFFFCKYHYDCVLSQRQGCSVKGIAYFVCTAVECSRIGLP